MRETPQILERDCNFAPYASTRREALAALTPREHEVELFHEQVRRAPVDDAPDLAAFSFVSGFARGAYDLADRHRALGVPVVGGGPHVTYWQEEAPEHFDALGGESRVVLG
jgi:hypothetical protein